MCWSRWDRPEAVHKTPKHLALSNINQSLVPTYKALLLLFWFPTVYPRNFQLETNQCSRRVGPIGVNRWPKGFFQSALYLYLGRSRMCLILQETCCSSLVLKPWRLDQETSEEKLFIKVGQIARHLRTDSSTPFDSWWIDRESSCLLDNSSIASR